MFNTKNRFTQKTGLGSDSYIGSGLTKPVIFRDDETGVLYLYFGYGITVLMNRDGTPMIDEEYVREKGWQ